ncbi:hypothetical protein HYQ45_000277 [Verticillium longisporum]|uniref:Uncharacterized protein n=1 Tax=Verticillium longisporum TaxID=100787 RepID=A0A8I3A1B7_VERLO|nr:hypothetical protein HYQ44_014143 [Verticillium longisporum]KAG7143485.1 hypothetical protein HYQ45_000277 [Verticillium longisporum]
MMRVSVARWMRVRKQRIGSRDQEGPIDCDTTRLLPDSEARQSYRAYLRTSKSSGSRLSGAQAPDHPIKFV